jgi:predicted RNase H-like HicB family nuclease
VKKGDLLFSSPPYPVASARGDSREKALKNIKEAIKLYLEPTETPTWQPHPSSKTLGGQNTKNYHAGAYTC